MYVFLKKNVQECEFNILDVTYGFKPNKRKHKKKPR